MIRKRQPLSAEAALSKAEMLCSVAEYCSFDIMKKLANWGISADDSYKIIERLIQKRFIDNNRFAHSFVNDKYKFSKWGRMKIRLSLYQKKIPSDVINAALEEAVDQDEYYNILVKLLRGKARMIKEGNSFEGRTKLFRFAASRGFETDLISKAIRSDRIFNLNDDSQEYEVE